METLNSITNSRFFTTTIGDLFHTNSDSETIKTTVNVIKGVALFAFNYYASWGQSTVYAISFFLGASLAYDIVPTHITNRISQVYAAAFVGIYAVMHVRDLPAILIMQAVLFGADLGHRAMDFCSRRPETEPGTTFSRPPVSLGLIK